MLAARVGLLVGLMLGGLGLYGRSPAPSPPLPAKIAPAPMVHRAPPRRLSPRAMSAALRAAIVEWTRVAVCEEGGNWASFTYWYPDALGITRPNWISAGGSVRAPSPRVVQVRIAQTLAHRWGIPAPDQDGACRAW